MAKRRLSAYQQSIVSDTGCNASEAYLVEEIMRCDVLHSTLDWLTPEEFRDAAILAYEVFQILKEDPVWRSFHNTHDF